MGRAIETTGLAGLVAQGMLGWMGTAHPWLVLAQVYLLVGAVAVGLLPLLFPF